MSLLLYVRHGQASFGKSDYDQLSTKGYEQGQSLGRFWVEQEFRLDTIYVGPLKRHWQTYEMVKKVYDEAGIDLPQPILFNALDEHRGPEILKRLMNVIVQIDSQVERWEKERRRNPILNKKNGLLIFERAIEMWASGMLDEYHPEEYLKWPEFRSIVGAGLDQILENHRKKRGEQIALFTSGGTISATVGKLLEIKNHVNVIGLNGIVQNTSLTEIIFNERKATLKSFNKVPHLSPSMITYI